MRQQQFASFDPSHQKQTTTNDTSRDFIKIQIIHDTFPYFPP
jgi:hypothetical protein